MLPNMNKKIIKVYLETNFYIFRRTEMKTIVITNVSLISLNHILHCCYFTKISTFIIPKLFFLY